MFAFCNSPEKRRVSCFQLETCMQASMLDLVEVAVSNAGEGQTHLCLYRMTRVGQRGTHDLKCVWQK